MALSSDRPVRRGRRTPCRPRTPRSRPLCLDWRCPMRTRRFRRRWFAALLVLATAAAAADVAQGTAPAPNGKLVFRRYLDADHTWSALFTGNTDGSGIRQITHPKRRVLDIVPNWSPSGEQIAFECAT